MQARRQGRASTLHATGSRAHRLEQLDCPWQQLVPVAAICCQAQLPQQHQQAGMAHRLPASRAQSVQHGASKAPGLGGADGTQLSMAAQHAPGLQLLLSHRKHSGLPASQGGMLLQGGSQADVLNGSLLLLWTGSCRFICYCCCRHPTGPPGSYLHTALSPASCCWCTGCCHLLLSLQAHQQFCFQPDKGGHQRPPGIHSAVQAQAAEECYAVPKGCQRGAAVPGLVVGVAQG